LGIGGKKKVGVKGNIQPIPQMSYGGGGGGGKKTTSWTNEREQGVSRELQKKKNSHKNGTKTDIFSGGEQKEPAARGKK